MPTLSDPIHITVYCSVLFCLFVGWGREVICVLPLCGRAHACRRSLVQSLTSSGKAWKDPGLEIWRVANLADSPPGTWPADHCPQHHLLAHTMPSAMPCSILEPRGGQVGQMPLAPHPSAPPLSSTGMVPGVTCPHPHNYGRTATVESCCQSLSTILS